MATVVKACSPNSINRMLHVNNIICVPSHCCMSDNCEGSGETRLLCRLVSLCCSPLQEEPKTHELA